MGTEYGQSNDAIGHTGRSDRQWFTHQTARLPDLLFPLDGAIVDVAAAAALYVNVCGGPIGCTVINQHVHHVYDKSSVYSNHSVSGGIMEALLGAH